MRIRTKFILVFIVLAVLPLTAIVLYSYRTSGAAVRSAVESETATLVGTMDGKMESFRTLMAERVDQVGDLPFRSLLEPAGDSGEFSGMLVAEMGDMAHLVDSIEFIPVIEGDELSSLEDQFGDLVDAMSDREEELAEQNLSAAIADAPEAVDARGGTSNPVAPVPPPPSVPPVPPVARGVVIDVQGILAEMRD